MAESNGEWREPSKSDIQIYPAIIRVQTASLWWEGLIMCFWNKQTTKLQ